MKKGIQNDLLSIHRLFLTAYKKQILFIQLIGFKEGNMTIRGYHIDIVGFGIHAKDSTTVTFCCKEDSNSTLSDVFPHDFPFVLLKV